MIHATRLAAVLRGLRRALPRPLRVVRLAPAAGRALAAGLALAASAASAAAAPNIVILLADDLGWNDVGYHGAPIATPSIDRLAREGVELDRFYSQPICTPTRAALLTGRSPLRTGLVFGVVREWDYFGLPRGEHLLSETLRAAGYQTAIVGKWHLGHAHALQTPTRRGFDHFYGHLLGELDYYTHTRFGGIDWQRDGETIREEGYTTDLIAREAVRLIEGRDPGRPLFLYVPFNAPHSPLQAPPELVERYAGLSSAENVASHDAFVAGVADRLGLSPEAAARIVDPPGEAPRPVFAAMVDRLDQAIGRILAALDRAGIADDTLVLFFSDNGGHVAQGASNAPLRGEKSTVYEGGIRVPAAVRWPKGLRGGRRVAQTVTAMDVFPTLLAAAGVEPARAIDFDGVDRWRAIRDPKAAPVAPEEIVFGVNGVVGRQEAIRHGRWKLIRTLGHPGDPTRILLFDVEGDPNEEHDLAASEPARVRDLVARLDRWIGLYPPGGAQGVHWPHPGWVPPADYGAAVRHDPPSAPPPSADGAAHGD